MNKASFVVTRGDNSGVAGRESVNAGPKVKRTLLKK